ncbi:TetR/AcrR family transcriptional regulator [Phenylobacterium sp.]|uniref:TetR/AcrR family transcriptional regulator n=1 Tax=Phenylobacterium sp. TaxID=1871053 RepID=UPI0035AF4DA7
MDEASNGEFDPGVSEGTRERLLRAGAAAFAELGYHAASTRLIEGAAGVKRNLISYHWGSKDAFWRACIDRMFNALGCDLDIALRKAERASADEGVEPLRRFVSAFVRASAAHAQVHSIMLDEGKRDESRLRWIVERHAAPFYARVASIFDRARALGATPHMDVASFYYTLVGASSFFTMAPERRLLTGQGTLTPETIDRHAESVARMLIRNAEDTA